MAKLVNGEILLLTLKENINGEEGEVLSKLNLSDQGTFRTVEDFKFCSVMRMVDIRTGNTEEAKLADSGCYFEHI